MLKRIVTIQDISCFGKCSLTVAHPILCAMGLETAVIPTAVLSTHTYQFKDYTFRDLTSDIPAIATHWKSLNLQFDGIYTGYLGSTEQVQIVSDFFDTFRNEHTSIIVDPVMGDAGKLYAGFTADFVQEMKALCKKRRHHCTEYDGSSPAVRPPVSDRLHRSRDTGTIERTDRFGCTDCGSDGCSVCRRQTWSSCL